MTKKGQQGEDQKDHKQIRMPQRKKSNSKLKWIITIEPPYIISIIKIKWSALGPQVYYNCSSFPECKPKRNAFVLNLLDLSAASDIIQCFFSVENPEILQGFLFLISPLNIWHSLGSILFFFYLFFLYGLIHSHDFSFDSSPSVSLQ